VPGTYQPPAELTRQLLAFARKQTISPKVLDLNNTIEGILRMMGRLIGEDIQLDWRAGQNLGPVFADATQIDQILANLCVNARDAISNVGTITVASGHRHIDAGDTTVPQGTPPLRQRDILRALLAERSARSAHRSRATVRLTRNAKGDVQPEVLVEVSDEEAGEAIAKAQHEATRVFDALCLVYSLGATPPNGAGGGGHDA
jgi:signal transduction histidine kinase